MVIDLDRFTIILLEWDKEYQDLIQEAYRLLKDQEKKIFDLTWYEDNQLEVMGYLQEAIIDDYTYIAWDNEKQKVAGLFILEGLRLYKGKALYANVHAVISKKYWGKASRDICNAFKKFHIEAGDIDKLIATIPQNNYPLIKLLKAIGFIHEGTIKNTVVYLDKNGNEKKYDELIYGLDLEDNNGIR